MKMKRFEKKRLYIQSVKRPIEVEQCKCDRGKYENTVQTKV